MKTRPRRILYVIGSLEVGGAERHVTQVAARLKERGWEPELYALVPGGPLASSLERAGVPVYGVALPRWMRHVVRNDRLRAWIGLVVTATALVGTLFRRRPETVHFFLPAAYIVGGLASLLYPVTARIMSRRSMNHYQLAHSLFARVERRLHSRMTLVCGNSQAVVEQLREEGIDSSRLRLIYNGIGLAPFTTPLDRNAVRESLQIQLDALVFIMVANLIPYKGHDDLLDALGEIKDALPPSWIVLCVGRDDGIGASLREKAQKIGIGNHVRFTGSRADVPDLLRIADIGVLCSHEEGFSNAVLEAMAAGLPMVVTDVGGNAEAVTDGEHGYVVPARSPHLLGKALLDLATDESRRMRGNQARQRVKDHFSMETCIDAYEKLYWEATGQSSISTRASGKAEGAEC